MKDENVEYNEIRCKTLLLGSEETGFIELRVTQTPDFPDSSPALSIFDPDNDNEAGIGIQFIDGRPLLSLQTRNKENGELTGSVILRFDRDGQPCLQISRFNEKGKITKDITLGLFNNDSPKLQLLSKEENSEAQMILGLNEENAPHVFMINEQLKGGNIFIVTDEDQASIMMTSNDRRISPENEHSLPWGILLVNDSEQSIISVEGKEELQASKLDAKDNPE